jgi:adenosylhomocysteine nucleosidase
LRRRISPLITGVGPVEAAVALTAKLAELKAASALPDLVVSLGSAGSNRLEQCGVYQASEVSWRDMDASAIGFPPGVTPFLDLPAVLPLGPFIPGVPAATLSTGGNIVSGAAAYQRIGADMVDMETYAMVRACQHFGVTLIALRGISDGAAEIGHIDDWTQCLGIIDEKLALALDRLEAAFAANALAPHPPAAR